MRASTRRLGLSFELAPSLVAHPNRTDIACFVGTVARRRAERPPRVMPPVLAAWLRDEGFAQIGGLPVEALAVELGTTSARRDAFTTSLLAQAGDDLERDRLRTALTFAALGSAATTRLALLNELLLACAELAPPPQAVLDDVVMHGFVPRRLLPGDELAGWLRVQRLHNLPFAVESFDAFERLCAWEARAVRERDPNVAGDAPPQIATALGAAVRAFFGEGGQRCWIVRTGDPVPLTAPPRERFGAIFPEPLKAGAGDGATQVDRDSGRCAQLTGVHRVVRAVGSELLIGVRIDALPVGSHPAEWQGLEHVYGLAEVSFACLPDLIDACAQSLPAVAPPSAEAAPPERFHDCVEALRPARVAFGRSLPAPALNRFGLEAWRQLVARALGLLRNRGGAWHRRDVQLLASLPLSGEGADVPAPGRWLEWLTRHPEWLAREADVEGVISSERLQLAHPWLRTRDSDDCQGGLEAPEGTLAGVLARSALQRGAFRSLAGQPVQRYVDSEPKLDWTRATQELTLTPLGALTFADFASLVGPAARGAQVLSDVTTSPDPQTRPGAVRRLVNVVLQAARIAGDELAFDVNGEALWAKVRERMADLGRVLLAGGALSTDGVPFVVRCGRDTMTQSDIDAGRLIAHFELLAAQPIERIVVVLALRGAPALDALRAA